MKQYISRYLVPFRFFFTLRVRRLREYRFQSIFPLFFIYLWIVLAVWQVCCCFLPWFPILFFCIYHSVCILGKCSPICACWTQNVWAASQNCATKCVLFKCYYFEWKKNTTIYVYISQITNIKNRNQIAGTWSEWALAHTPKKESQCSQENIKKRAHTPQFSEISVKDWLCLRGAINECAKESNWKRKIYVISQYTLHNKRKNNHTNFYVSFNSFSIAQCVSDSGHYNFVSMFVVPCCCFVAIFSFFLSSFCWTLLTHNRLSNNTIEQHKFLVFFFDYLALVLILYVDILPIRRWDWSAGFYLI